MRYKPGHREESRARILSAIGRGFRQRGYQGIGVDGLASEAGMTSGAFYGHFSSKQDAFQEAVVHGLRQLKEGIAHFQEKFGADWITHFIDFYLGEKRTCNLAESCALQSLTPEVSRADIATRTLYQAELQEVLEVIANGLPHGTSTEKNKRAWSLLSLLAGGVTTMRACADAAFSEQAAKAIRDVAIAIAAQP